MPRHHLILLAAASLLPFSAMRADDATAAATFQSRMRDTLRNTMQQLNDAQTQLAAAQAAQAQDEKDKADLQAKLDALSAQLKDVTQQNAADKEAADKKIADLNAQVATDTKQMSALEGAIAQWKTAYGQVTQLARNTEDARAKLAGEKALLQRLVDDREVKNAELYKTGTEVLDRYEKFSLGDAISAKEPFIGTTRVRLETLVQDYQDKLMDERVSPGQAVSTSAPAKKIESSGEVQTAQISTGTDRTSTP